jgi:hypothetical protein
MGVRCHQTGWRSDGGSASDRKIFPGLVPGGFSPLPHAGHENSEADTHVESHGEVPSDAGSTPAASTIPRSTRSGVGVVARLSAYALTRSAFEGNSRRSYLRTFALRARPSTATPEISSPRLARFALGFSSSAITHVRPSRATPTALPCAPSRYALGLRPQLPRSLHQACALRARLQLLIPATAITPNSTITRAR